MTKEEFAYWDSEDPQKLKDRIAEEGRKLAQTWEDEYLVKAGDLMLAGWKPEYERPDMPCMSWSWRRPAKFPRSIGKLFRSTDQAWNAMMKE
jgi:hypothetical protein